MLAMSMRENKICRYCKLSFQPSRYRKDQRVCSSIQCQRRRRTEYHRKKLAEDPLYKEQCCDSQRKWRERNPAYMRDYRAELRRRDPLSNKSSLSRELRRLLKLVKNNVVLDLKSLDASVWLVCRKGVVSGKNTLASAKVIILQAIPH